MKLGTVPANKGATTMTISKINEIEAAVSRIDAVSPIDELTLSDIRGLLADWRRMRGLLKRANIYVPCEVVCDCPACEVFRETAALLTETGG